jgi:flagellar basal body-associated protein FliL
MSQAPATAAAPTDAAPKAKSSKVVLVLVVLNLVAVAGVGGYVALQMQKHPPAAPGAHGAAAAHGEEAADDEEAPASGAHEEEEEEDEDEEGEGHGARPIIALEAIITNFVDAEETHFLKVTVQLEAKNEASKVKIEEAMVPIRDLVLLRLSSLTLDETRGADKKRALQAELRTMINAELHSRRVKHVYFTEFVVQ